MAFGVEVNAVGTAGELAVREGDNLRDLVGRVELGFEDARGARNELIKWRRNTSGDRGSPRT